MLVWFGFLRTHLQAPFCNCEKGRFKDKIVMALKTVEQWNNLWWKCVVWASGGA